MTNDIPEVIVQDQATNGLVVQSSVNAGDYVVVDKEELVTNGTFDTDTDWTKSTGWSISGGVASSDGTGTGFPILLNSNTGAILPNVEYVVSFKVVSCTQGSVFFTSGDVNGTQRNSAGEYTETITSTVLGNLAIAGTNSTQFIGSIDNISVRRVSDVYRAKQDTPSGTAITNTTYFEDRTQFGITNKILATMKDDGTIKIEANAISEQDELNRVGTKAKSGQLDGIGGVVATYKEPDGTSSASSGAGYIYLSGTKPDWWGNLGAISGTVTMNSTTDTKIYVFNGSDLYYWTGNTTRRPVSPYPYGCQFLRVSDDAYFPSDGAFTDFLITKTLPHPSSGTALRTDWIGDPANYPQAVKDRLASGLPMIGMNKSQEV